MGSRDKTEPIRIAIVPEYHALVNSLCPKCKEAIQWHNYQTKGANLCRVDRKRKEREVKNDKGL